MTTLPIAQDFLSTLVAGVKVFSFTANDHRDPFGTHSSNLPRMLSFWSTLYNTITVRACKLTVDCVNLSTNVDEALLCIVTDHHESSTPAYSNIEDVKMNRRTRFRLVPSLTTANTSRRITAFRKTRHVFDVATLKPLPHSAANPGFTLNIGSSPTSTYTWYWAVIMQNAQWDSTKTTQFRLRCKMELFVELSEKVIALPE